MGKTNFNQTALDKEMQKGYRLNEENNVNQAVVTWMKVWEKIKRIIEKHNISSVEEMNKKFKGTQLISNWASDFEMTLTNAANKDTKFLKDKYKFCTEYVARAAEQSDHNILNMKSAMAQMHFKMQEPEKGEQLFEELTSKYPQWVGAGSFGRTCMVSLQKRTMKTKKKQVTS